MVLSLVTGGDWVVSDPSSCRLVYHVDFLPTHADVGGWGTTPKEEITEWIARAARSDPWLAEHPPTSERAPQVPAVEIPPDSPIVPILLDVNAAVGIPSQPGRSDGWYDGAAFTQGGTPSVAYFPADAKSAHVTDEFALADELVLGTQALALSAMRFCGTA